MRKIREDEVTFTIKAELESAQVRGNARATGHEDEIVRRLLDGDVWAWAQVTVTATLRLPGATVAGYAYLGYCSYADEAEFMRCGDYKYMKQEALADVQRMCLNAIAHGMTIAERFAEGSKQ